MYVGCSKYVECSMYVGCSKYVGCSMYVGCSKYVGCSMYVVLNICAGYLWWLVRISSRIILQWFIVNKHLFIYLFVRNCLSIAFSTQTCYHCNYYASSSNDPGIQTALTVLQSRQPAYTQCGNFPYYSRSSVPTIDCNSLNASAYYTNGFGGMPFTGWMCAKQSYTMTLKNYGNVIIIRYYRLGMRVVNNGGSVDENGEWIGCGVW